MTRHLANEDELVQAAQSGDREALGTLLDHFYPTILRYVVKITRNSEDAEDVLQEALFKASCNVHRFQGNSRFYTWLVRISINEALMKLRSKRAQRQVPLEEVVESDLGAVQSEDCSYNPEKHCAQREMREALEDALDGLSPRLCAAFVLRNVEERSMRETAAMLGLSPSAVKSRVVRARSRLRKRLRIIWGHGASEQAKSRELGNAERQEESPEPGSYVNATA